MAKTESEKTATMAALATAGAALSSGSSKETALDKQLKAALAKQLNKMLEAEEADEERLIRQRQEMVESYNEAAEERRQKQALCPHTKENGETRLAGQRIGFNEKAQVALVCSGCGKEYHFPVLHKDQEAPPQVLVPPMESIGGQTG